MGRAVKYPWDEILSREGAEWFFDYENRNTVRASLNAWAKARGKKVKTKRVRLADAVGDGFSFMLEVTLVG